MLTKYQADLVQDVRGYGGPLAGWKGQTEIFRAHGAPAHPDALLDPKHLDSFVERTYFLIVTARVIKLYRGCERGGLKAPYGMDHPSFWLGLVTKRNPATPDGCWWSPMRPGVAIDNLHLPSWQREQARADIGVKKEWSRLDFWIEADLRCGSLVYIGRTAPQKETAMYGGGEYHGGAIQFRLTEQPEIAFLSMTKYDSI